MHFVYQVIQEPLEKNKSHAKMLLQWIQSFQNSPNIMTNKQLILQKKTNQVMD